MQRYPTEFEEVAKLPCGVSLRIRPIRMEDESLLIDFVARATPEDRRMRFFASSNGLTHEAALRLVRIDYDRNMALIAQPIERDEIIGVARYSTGPARRVAEFAVMVRSDWKAHGVGWLLMEKLVAAARKRGISIMSGLVIRENHDMVQFCRDLGFAITSDVADPEMLCASLDLAALPARAG